MHYQSLNRAALGAALAILIAAGDASAQSKEEMCTAIKTVLAETSNHYLRFRGSYDSVYDSYVGTYSIPPLTECMMSAKDESSIYKCSRRLGDDETAAKNMLIETAATINRCFGNDIKQTSFRKDASYLWFRHVITGESLRLKYQRIVPRYTNKEPFYLFSLEVSFREPD